MSANKPEKTLSPGATFGRYMVVRILGAGGMGAVYEAVHSDLKKRVALKILHPEYAQHEEVQARFLREGESASRIRHPHVVDVTDFGVHEQTPFLVMEYLEGESLSALLEREGRISAQRIADLMLPVCAAVGAAHEASVIHRDLKPDNVFLERKRGDVVPKVVDFGISKVTEEHRDIHSLTSTGAMIGTPSYMSPEQMRQSKAVDARSDQYAIGVMMYECVTGDKPFVAETLFEIMNKIVHGECTPPRERLPDLPEAFEAVVMRAMNKDPARRFPSVRALGKALLEFASTRQRLVWEPEFGDVPVEEPPPPADVPSQSTNAALAHSDTEVPPHTLGNTGREIDARSPDAAPPRPGVGLWIGAGAVVLAGIIGVAWRMQQRPAPRAPVTVVSMPVATTQPTTESSQHRPSTYSAVVQTQPTTAQIELDGAPAGTGSVALQLVRDGTAHTLVVSAPQFQTQTIAFRDEPPPRDVVLQPVAVAAVADAADASSGRTAPTLAGAHHHGAATSASTARADHAASTDHDAPATHSNTSHTESTTESASPNLGTNGAAILQ